MPKPFPRLMTTTCWEYASQQHRRELETLKHYKGATPSYIIWNLLKRYTRPNDLVVDPMCGSGTTLDVARELKRRVLGYDLMPVRKDIFRADARKLPLESEKADLRGFNYLFIMYKMEKGMSVEPLPDRRVQNELSKDVLSSGYKVSEE